ncbi:radical SAM protein [Streptomyces sp. 4N509B]|uniref:radical SAM protein n=1 Tax=Streptomyces sp. 4N509B TaxID=3457413 RepID=UPI003FD29630
MRLAELMSLRQTVGAGLLVTLTERCPLSCAHCSASATPTGRDLDDEALLRFLRTFTPRLRPEVLLLTGGEPLTRPRLVVEAARAAREAGTRTAVLSGGFFARGGGGGLPPAVRRVAHAVDHFSLSLDAHHEREVPRRDVLAALAALLRTGVATSLHVLADGPDDPYPDEVAAEVTARFGTRVPMLVGEVRAIGRGASLRPGARPAAPAPPPGSAVAPCAMAAWPVVTADGTVTACCEQTVVDGRVDGAGGGSVGGGRPAHLRVGAVATDSWPAVLDRTARDPLLRMIRTVGPVHLAARAGADPAATPAAAPVATPEGGYCASCHRLGALPEAGRWARRAGAGPCGELLQSAAVRVLAAGGPAALVARHGSRRHAHLVTLGSADAVGTGGAGGAGGAGDAEGGDGPVAGEAAP